jgi:asparagine synthase (glutamine-hydrolysing)
MIAGWFDWRLASRHARPRVSRDAGGRCTVSAPGLEVTVDADDADVAVRDGHVVIAAGRPRFGRDLDRAPGTPASKWMQLVLSAGEQAAAGVEGRYAVAAIDLGAPRALLATDRFAVLPLCYGVEGSRLAFASRADRVPLACDAELDAQSVFHYLYFHVIPAPRTVYREVFRLEAARTLSFDAQGMRTARHWTPVFEESRTVRLADLVTEFRARLDEAVADALVDSGNPGCFLSGGTDSSTVAGLVGRVTGRPARTFSIGFDAQGYDEMAYARIAARHFRTEHHEHYVTPDELVDAIPAVAAHYDQPFGNSSAVPAYLCARVAADAGIDCLLAGDGGDELFGGNTRYAKQQVFALYGNVPQPLRTRLLEPVLLRAPLVGRAPLLRKAASYVAQARTPMPDRMNAYNLLLRLGPEEMLEPEFLAQVSLGTLERQSRGVYEECEAASLVNRMLCYDWKYTLADNDLPKVRETARLAGVDARFPLLDDALVDFSLRLPPAFKVRGLALRWFFKEALRGFLPDEIIAKRKHGFGLPFGVWLRRHDRLRSFAHDTLAGLRGRGIVRAAFIDRLLDDIVAAHPGYYGEMVWVLMMLGQWLDGRPRLDAAPPPAPRDRLAHGYS